MEKTWNTFWETGRIDDYLEICREKESDREQEVRQNGAEPCNDRNGFKCDADWRGGQKNNTAHEGERKNHSICQRGKKTKQSVFSCDKSFLLRGI